MIKQVPTPQPWDGQLLVLGGEGCGALSCVDLGRSPECGLVRLCACHPAALAGAAALGTEESSRGCFPQAVFGDHHAGYSGEAGGSEFKSRLSNSEKL